MADPYTKTVSQSSGPANITLAKVTSVNFAEWTVELLTVYTLQPLGPIPFATPYCHRDHGGGINFMPEIDSYCYVCSCADGTQFIIGFVLNPITVQPTLAGSVSLGAGGAERIEAMADQDPSWRGFRHPLEPGDIYLGTADENQIVVRRGGIVQIGSTGLAQRIYIPVENVVRDYFQRYQAFSPVGEIEWGHAVLAHGESPSAGTGSVPNSNYFLDEDQKNALKTAEETPVLVRYNIKDLAQEDVSKGKYTVELRVGRLTSEALDTEVDAEHIFANTDLRQSKGKPEGEGIAAEEKGVISITIYSHDDGDNKDKVTYAFQLNRDGDNFVFTKGSIRHEIEKDLYASVHGSARMDWGSGAKDASDDSYVEFLKSNEFEMACKKVVMDVLNSVEIKSPHVDINAGTIDLGDSADAKVVRYQDLETFMKTAFQCVTAWGPSGPMVTSFSATPNVGSASVKVKK